MCDPPSPEDLVDMRETIERLTVHIELLTRAVDDLAVELQWRNNQLSDDAPDPPFHLTSLPLDPTTPDWHINQASSVDIDAPAAAPRTQQPLFD